MIGLPPPAAKILDMITMLHMADAPDLLTSYDCGGYGSNQEIMVLYLRALIQVHGPQIVCYPALCVFIRPFRRKYLYDSGNLIRMSVPLIPSRSDVCVICVHVRFRDDHSEIDNMSGDQSIKAKRWRRQTI